MGELSAGGTAYGVKKLAFIQFRTNASFFNVVYQVKEYLLW